MSEEDPREVEEIRKGLSKQTKEEFNEYLRSRNLTVRVINHKVCLIAREDLDN